MNIRDNIYVNVFLRVLKLWKRDICLRYMYRYVNKVMVYII